MNVRLLRRVALSLAVPMALLAGPLAVSSAAAGPAAPGDPELPVSAYYTGAVPGTSASALAAVGTTPLRCDDNGSDQNLTRDEVISRARSWLSVGGVPYSQERCYRNANGDYRTDCSGFVAMAWGLGGRGDEFWTGNLDNRSFPIARSSLQAGDALLRHTGDPDENHVALFVKWADADHTRPVVIEQTGGDVDSTIERAWSSSYASSYTPVRYDNIINGNFDSFDGDARADMIVHAGTEVSVRKGGSGGGFGGGTVATTGWGRYHGMQVPDGLGRVFFADFNDDHFTDMIVHHGSDVSVRYNNGQGAFDGGRTVSTGWGRYHGLQVSGGLGRLYFADFTGDGRADMIVHHGSDISVRHNVGEAFDGGHAVTSGWGRYHGVQVPDGLGRVFFADINRDDKADMVVHDGSDVSVRYNTSGGFDGGRTITSGWGRYHGLDAPNGLGRLHFADYNGDQLDDMIVHDGSAVSVRLNVGGAFDSGRTVTSGWGRFHGIQIADGLGRLYFS
jgi:hypothetical protein